MHGVKTNHRTYLIILLFINTFILYLIKLIIFFFLNSNAYSLSTRANCGQCARRDCGHKSGDQGAPWQCPPGQIEGSKRTRNRKEQRSSQFGHEHMIDWLIDCELLLFLYDCYFGNIFLDELWCLPFECCFSMITVMYKEF